MKVLIILIRFNASGYIYDKNSTKRKCNYLMPVGLAYISAILKRMGHDVDCLNLNHYDGHVQNIISRELWGKKYDVVFLGGLSLYYPHIRDTIQYIRHASPKIKIVVGGGIITSQPDIMFRLHNADYGIIGEGEFTAIDLLNCLEMNDKPEDVNGIIYRSEDGWYIITPQRDPINNLDTLPFPDYEGFGYTEYLDRVKPHDFPGYDVEDYPRFYPVLASRSCPYNCTFCFHTMGKKYRQRSVDNIMDELRYAIPKYRINIVLMYDELFSHNKERIFEFCDKFKEFTDTLGWTIRFSAAMRVDSIDDEMLRKMKMSGAYLLGYGLESYSQTVLDSMKKHTKPEQIDRMFHLMNDNQLGVQGTFIFGDIAETCKTANETLDYYTQNPDLIRGGVSAGFIIPFQGSPIYRHCVKNGKIKDEVEFIKSRQVEGYNYNEPMNMTDALNTGQFERLKDAVLTAHLTAWKYSVPIDDGNGGVVVKCPFCKEVSHIGNYPKPGWFEICEVGCRHCFSRFRMTSGWYFIERFLIKTFGFNRVYQMKKRLVV